MTAGARQPGRTWFGARRSSRRRAPNILLWGAGLITLLIVAPFGLTIFDAVQGDVARAWHLLWRPVTAHLLFNTVTMAVVTTVVCALLGTATAWLMERSDLPGRRVWSLLVPMPLAIPAFIASFAWISVGNVFYGPAGALLVLSASYYPLIYLPVAAALRNMDPALEESARTMGCTRWQAFRRAVFPQIKPALLGGMLLVILHAFTEFGAFKLLRFRTFTTAIYADYRVGMLKEGALLACVLLGLCVLCLVAEQFLRGHRDQARVGGGTRRAQVRQKLGKARWPSVVGMVILAVVTLGVPLSLIGFWLFRDIGVAWQRFVSPARLLEATWHSLSFGALASIVTTLLALPIAYLSVRSRRPVVQVMERASFLPRGMPGIVLALSLVAFSQFLDGFLYQTTTLLILAYAIIFFPLAVVSLRVTLAQVQPALEDSARVLGHRPPAVLRRIVLPLAGPGVGAGMALVFIMVATELTSTLLLRPTGMNTLATQFWATSTNNAYAAAAPYAAILVIISMFATWIMANRFGRSPVDAE